MALPLQNSKITQFPLIPPARQTALCQWTKGRPCTNNKLDHSGRALQSHVTGGALTAILSGTKSRFPVLSKKYLKIGRSIKMPDRPDHFRRSLIAGAPLFGAASLIFAGDASAAETPPQVQDPRVPTFKENDHIKTFYRLARD